MDSMGSTGTLPLDHVGARRGSSFGMSDSDSEADDDERLGLTATPG